MKTTRSPTLQEMDAWLQSPLGQRLLEVEQGYLQQVLARRFGYHLLQLGNSTVPMYESSPIGHRFSLTEDYAAFSQGQAEPEAIPLVSESVDLVLLHHVLDFSPRQHQLLREVSRVLIAGGHAVILGFNPYSTWGLRKGVSRSRATPWQADMLSPRRLCDWLQLLDFQVEQVRFGMYCLPVNSARWIRYSSLLERLATRLNWPTGGMYLISARKQVAPLTPIQARWRRFPGKVGLPIPENAGGYSPQKKQPEQKQNIDKEQECRK